MQLSNFDKDLSRGKVGEHIVLGILKDKGASIIDGEYKGGDILLSDGHMIEVKTDYESANTRNHFVETMCNHKNSGIRTTMSKWWVVVTANAVSFCYPSAIKAQEELSRNVSFVNEDGYLVKGYLIPFVILSKILKKKVPHNINLALQK